MTVSRTTYAPHQYAAASLQSGGRSGSLGGHRQSRVLRFLRRGLQQSGAGWRYHRAFSQYLIKNNLDQRLFEQVAALLEAKGLLLKKGTIVDINADRGAVLDKKQRSQA